jgi:replicative DNA helicase
MASSGRIPPHNDSAERAVLGAILMSANAYSEVTEVLRKDDFYKPNHQALFDAILTFHQDNVSQAIDLITITEHLKAKNLLALCGGMAYVASLTSDVPTTANAIYYAKIVKANAMRRSLLELSGKMREDVFDESQDIALIMDENERLMSDLQAYSGTFTDRYVESSTLINETVQNLVYRAEHGNENAIKSGFSQLDEMTGGFFPSEFIVIGARPSVGKTAFAISMAINMAIHNKIPVGFFSAEMTSMAIMERILAAEAMVDAKRIRKAILRSQDMVSIIDAASRIYEGKLFIQDTPNIKLLDLRSQARRMKREQDIKILFIDYIGLINPEASPGVPRHEQVAEISRSLKALSRELQIPIVALSQVSRDAEGKEPNLANLRDSGSVEQDADVVIFLHRDRLADLTDHTSDRNGEQERSPIFIEGFPVQETKVILAKQRHGETGIITMGFQNQLVRFVEMEHHLAP